MTINVYGNIVLKLKFDVEIPDMTEKEWDALSERQQNHMIESRINYGEEMRNAEVDEVDVWEAREID